MTAMKKNHQVGSSKFEESQERVNKYEDKLWLCIVTNRKEKMKIIYRFREVWDTIKCVNICVAYQKSKKGT